VYFNAWAGSERINAYLQWAAANQRAPWREARTRQDHRHGRSGQARAREKAAGKLDGTVDLVWINGENFLTMKREGLLFGPFAESLPKLSSMSTWSANPPRAWISRSRSRAWRRPGAWPS
jgi:putative thiamine transport system substrate-binding protein